MRPRRPPHAVPDDSGATGATTARRHGHRAGRLPAGHGARRSSTLAKQPVPFVALYDLIQGGNAGTLRLAYDGDTRIAYRVELADQGTIWAGFAGRRHPVRLPAGAGPRRAVLHRRHGPRAGVPQPDPGVRQRPAVRRRGRDELRRPRRAGPPVLPGEMTGAPVACIQSVGAAHPAALRARRLDHHRGHRDRGGQGDRRPGPPGQPRGPRGRLRAPALPIM